MAIASVCSAQIASRGAERCKLMQAIITRITVYEDRITIEPNIADLNTLLAEAGMEKKDEQN